MSDTGNTIAVEELLAERENLCALARRLVRDEHRADDLVQDVYTGLLERPPVAVRSLRSWLASVLRNRFRDLRRSETARRERERRYAAARGPGGPDAAELLAGVDAQQRLAEAVLSLPEPERTTVVLHYRGDHSIRETARRMGVPYETARDRHSRALGILRERLRDRKDRSLPVGLLVLAGSRPRAAAAAALGVAGGLLMTAKTKLVIAGLAILLLAGGIYSWRVTGPDRPPGSPPEAARPGPPPPEAPQAATETVADTGETPEREGALAVVGRVVDDRRRPVGDAFVAVSGAFVPERTARTLADGTFRVDGVEAPAAGLALGLVARTADGRAAMATIRHREGEIRDAGTIVLETGAPLAVRVVSDRGPVAGARVWAGRSGGLQATARSGEEGLARFEALPQGPVDLVALAESPLRRGSGGAVVAPGAPAVDLAVRLARDVTVIVREKGSGRPVTGAEFRVWVSSRQPGGHLSSIDPLARPVARTDGDGRTVIEGTDPEDSLTIGHLVAPGYAMAHRRIAVPPGEEEALIELDPPSTVRFPIEPGEAPVPPDGAVIRLEEMPGSGASPPPPEGRMEGDTLVVSLVPAGFHHAIAVAPDGSRARLFLGKDESEGRTASFRPARTVGVRVVDADGNPVEGAGVILRNQGNNPMTDVRETNADGRVVFTGLYGGKADVFVLGESKFAYGGIRAGTIDLDEGDGRVEAVLAAEREFVVRFLVDGESRLPADLALRVVDGSEPLFSVQIVSRFEEDPGAGEVRFAQRISPEADEVTVFYLARRGGARPAQATAPVPPEGPIVVDLAIGAAGALHVRVSPPADGRYDLRLQLRGEAGKWEPAASPGPGMLSRDPDGVVRIPGLAPGTYRVVESRTGVVTEPADVVEGREPPLVGLDLSRMGVVTGRVVLPEGDDASAARILVTGEGLLPPDPADRSRTGTVWGSGNFRVRVPGDRPVVLLPWHPVLVPAAQGGRVEVTEPREDVTLVLERGSRVELRLRPAPEGHSRLRSVRALLYRGDPVNAPESEVDVVVSEDGHAVFGGVPPGRFTVFLDVPGYAPAVLRDVTIGEGTTDLGEVRLEAGASIRVRVLVPEGEDPPRVHVTARREEAPVYTRSSNSSGQAEFVLGGFGPGRFRVEASPVMGGRRVEAVLELDGRSERVLVLDFR